MTNLDNSTTNLFKAVKTKKTINFLKLKEQILYFCYKLKMQQLINYLCGYLK